MQYWRWRAYGDTFMVDPNSPGSHTEMYWWDVIHGMYSQWEADKHKNGGKQGDGPKKRTKGGARKKPVKQSERGKKT